MRILPWVGAATVAVAAGVLVTSNLAQAADEPPSLVEDYVHPGSEQILAQYGLKVFKGDGHIMFTERKNIDVDGQCATAEIQIEQMVDVDPYSYLYCFKTIGTSGFLTLEVPSTFGVRAGNVPVEATASTPEGEKTYDVPANRPVPIYPGTDDELPQAVLVELRLNG
uniref:hypothetical protein n=1 Tax=Paractinoplanes polyasparticus TaxID=2856853 RepID=UPI001C85F059|nr:hypothetical protein [Actinoplanes polyasparticus]